eukprot:EG_transcript_26613
MSFVMVRHGNDQMSMFNSNCSNAVLLNYIKQTAGYPDIEMVDLISANLQEKNLSPLQLFTRPSDYANADLHSRGVYILLRVEEEGPGVRTYSPLLDSEDGRRLKALLESRTTDERKRVPGKAARKK